MRVVAALFALHPLHVESVVWLAERRDVLSGLFFMLTLGAYGEYVRHPQSLGRYFVVVGFFVLGLLAKPMLVTLPPLLLLLDYWPLGRFRGGHLDAISSTSLPAPFRWRIVVDKLPLLGLALAAAGVTMITHDAPSSNPLTLAQRFANAAVSCVAYLGQLFVPVGLSPMYSHPEAGLPAWHVAATAALLFAITAAAVIGRRAYPYFFVGWFWNVGMLVPVLGLTFVGMHARADRYTYLSQIGLYIALVWGAVQLGAPLPARRWVFGIGSAIMLTALMACSWRQVGFWHDDGTLWKHALACDPKSATARYSLGTVLERTGEPGAVEYYRQALELGPNERNIYSMIRCRAHIGLGNFAVRNGDFDEAIAQYEQALESDSHFAPAHVNLGALLAKKGDLSAAVAQIQQGIELAPDDAAPYYQLAIVLSAQGKNDEAIANFRKALKADPNFAPAKRSLEQLLNR